MTPAPARSPHVFGRGSWPEARRIADVLRKETIGGVLLLAGAVAALVWANSPWADSYESVRSFTFGPQVLHLNLSVGTWAADGLLAIFSSSPAWSSSGSSSLATCGILAAPPSRSPPPWVA